jgi:hypothetical protein
LRDGDDVFERAVFRIFALADGIDGEVFDFFGGAEAFEIRGELFDALAGAFENRGQRAGNFRGDVRDEIVDARGQPRAKIRGRVVIFRGGGEDERLVKFVGAHDEEKSLRALAGFDLDGLSDGSEAGRVGRYGVFSGREIRVERFAVGFGGAAGNFGAFGGSDAESGESAEWRVVFEAQQNLQRGLAGGGFRVGDLDAGGSLLRGTNNGGEKERDYYLCRNTRAAHHTLHTQVAGERFVSTTRQRRRTRNERILQASWADCTPVACGFNSGFPEAREFFDVQPRFAGAGPISGQNNVD